MFPPHWHRYLFLISLICLISGGMFGASLFSIGQIALAANWFLEGKYISKMKQLRGNSVFWVLVSFYMWHLVGMAYTHNSSNGLADLGNKVPLLILPILFFSSKPLSNKEFNLLLHSFYVAVVLSSLYCFYVFLGYTKHVVIGARDACVFMSHIRFALFIVFAISGLVYSFINEQHKGLKLLYIIGITWLLFFIYKLELMTGFACLAAVTFTFLIVIVFKKLKKSVVVFISLLLLSSVFISFAVLKSHITMFDVTPHLPSNKLLTKTVNHRIYLQDTAYQLAENGTLIGINICDEELQNEWAKRSAIDYKNADKKGNELRYTILHYLASKTLTKDSVGLSQLTNQDIKNIEEGFTNHHYCSHGNIINRWRELIWEYTKYKRGENPSGHTLTMRIEFWKTALHIIKQQPLFGVGTGDIQDSFNAAYVETHTKLNKQWWLRCHNQYLAVTVAFGIIGLFVFLFYLFYPAYQLRNHLHGLYYCFLIISLVSFITEDSLENQAGVTFFAFFNSLFLWLAYCKQTKHLQ